MNCYILSFLKIALVSHSEILWNKDISTQANCWRHNKDWEKSTYLKRQPWMIKKNLLRGIQACRYQLKIVRLIKLMFEKTVFLIQMDGLVIPNTV